MPLTILASSRMLDHITPVGHPERVERAETMLAVVERWREAGVPVAAPRMADDSDLLRVHVRDHLEALMATRGRAVMLDADTFTSPESEEVARLAVGAVLDGVDVAMNGAPGSRAMAVVRPPGHHAEAAEAMGFCLYNSVAAGAAYARSRGAATVAIVDYDVHHGNGTQAIFYADPSVLYVSTHQFPYYPGTGAASEVGVGRGTGFTLNFPIEAGATDADYDLVFRDGVVPAVRAYRPDLLLVSAGFDAHERDPLAGMRLTTEGYARVTARLLAVADEVCSGRAVFVTEGGYDLHALETCLDAVMGVLSGARTIDLGATPSGDLVRGAASLAAFATAHGDRWPARDGGSDILGRSI